MKVIAYVGKEVEDEMDGWIHLGVFIIKSEVLKQSGVTT